MPQPAGSDYPLLSVITPVHEAAAGFLPAAAASLAQQSVPLHWIICFDGDEVPADVRALVDTQCRTLVPALTLVASKRQAGAATARMVALGLVGTPWTATLDADDVWLPGGLDTLFETAVRTEAAWCAGLTVDVVDGLPVEYPDHLPTGPVAPRAVFAEFERRDSLPFVAGAMVWRTETLWDSGGWPALPACEDTALVLAASERYAGYYLGGKPVYGYTKYPGQTTSAPRHTARLKIATAHHYRRIAAIRNAAGPPTRAAGLPADCPQ